MRMAPVLDALPKIEGVVIALCHPVNSKATATSIRPCPAHDALTNFPAVRDVAALLLFAVALGFSASSLVIFNCTQYYNEDLTVKAWRCTSPLPADASQVMHHRGRGRAAQLKVARGDGLMRT